MKPMSVLLSVLAFASFASTAHADSLYTCANDKGDTVMIKITPDGQCMALRSLYAKMSFKKSQRRDTDAPGYTFYLGRYPTGNGEAEALVAVQTRLVKGRATGSITLDSEDYDCKAGAGRLKVSRQTRDELNPPERKEPCKLTSYYGGITFMPPRIVCDYGGGFTVITGGGGVL